MGWINPKKPKVASKVEMATEVPVAIAKDLAGGIDQKGPFVRTE